MNAEEARLLRIKRYSSEQVAELHEVERLADIKWRESADKAWGERGDGFTMAGLRFMARLDNLLGPYWIDGKESGDQAREIANFLEHPAVRRALAKYRASPEDEPELTAVHLLDWSAWKDGPQIHHGKGDGGNQRKLAEIYKRAEPRSVPYDASQD